jgi:integrase
VCLSKMAINENETSERTNAWIDEEIKSAISNMVPNVSGEKYKRAYEKYQVWRQESNLSGPTNERELFAYLHKMMDSNKWQSPGTIWCKFSMLKSMILSKEGLDIKETSINSQIQTWLKRVGATHKSKQAHMFNKEDVMRFLREAPMSFIGDKLILMVGVYTGLRCDTIAKLEWRHISLTLPCVKLFIDYETKTDQGANGT